MPTEEPIERVAAMIEWLKEINGGTLPQRSSASPAIDGLDALVAKLGNTSLEDIKANMSDEFQSKLGISDMTETALKSLILSAAKMAFETEEALNSLTLSAANMSISSDKEPEAEDDEAMLDAPQQATYAHNLRRLARLGGGPGAAGDAAVLDERYLDLHLSGDCARLRIAR
jgi:hypothetical protein